MSLLTKHPLFNSLITFSKNGIEIADYAEIRNAMTTRYKEIYGDDVDLSTSNADGQHVEMMCLIINNILQSFKTLYSNLDVETAQGKFLDMLCSLTNVSRKSEKHSSANMNVTLLDRASITVGPSWSGATYQSIEFLDKNGTEWVFTPSELVTLQQDVQVPIQVVCSIGGPVRADIGWIDRTVDPSIVMTIEQTEPAELGSYEETDSQLRARRMQILGNSGITVLQSLAASILNLEGIEDIKIYNNDSSQDVTSKDGTLIRPHGVYIILRKLSTIAASKEDIGSTLYEKLTPGITFATPGETSLVVPSDGDIVNDTEHNIQVGVVKISEYVQRIQGQVVETGITQFARWKEAMPASPKIFVHITKYVSYDSSRLATSAYASSTSDTIARTIINYMNGLSLSENAKCSLIRMQAQLADPLFKGLPTFYIDNVSINDAEADYVNHDTFYKYTSYTVLDGSTPEGQTAGLSEGEVEIRITGSESPIPQKEE